MADNSAPAAQDFNNSGFAEASGVAQLQNQANQIKVDDASLRQQAVQQYNPTYEAEQRSLSTQLQSLIKAQSEDTDLLDSQYQTSINTMMSKLAKRGLNTGATPTATTDALNKFRNEVMSQRQAAYGIQQQGIRNMQDTLRNDYELNIKARMAVNRDNALNSLNDLMTLISKLQTSSYEDYIKYLLGKKDIENNMASLDVDLIQQQGVKLSIEGDRMGLEGDIYDLENKKMQLDKQYKKGGGGGGGRRYSSSGTSTATPTTTISNPLGTSYFAGSGTTTSGTSAVKNKVSSVISAIKPLMTNRSSGGGGKSLALTR